MLPSAGCLRWHALKRSTGGNYWCPCFRTPRTFLPSQLSFLGPELTCDWGISSAQEGLLTTMVFLGMML